MGTTRNVTTTGFYVRKRVKRSFISWLWSLVQGAVAREHVVAWSPTQACVCCHKQIEQDAQYCPSCGIYQAVIVPPQQSDPQTEAIQRLPSPVRQTEELACATSQMYAVRIGELRPIHQYLQEQKRKKSEDERKKAEEELRNAARRAI